MPNAASTGAGSPRGAPKSVELGVRRSSRVTAAPQACRSAPACAARRRSGSVTRRVLAYRGRCMLTGLGRIHRGPDGDVPSLARPLRRRTAPRELPRRRHRCVAAIRCRTRHASSHADARIDSDGYSRSRASRPCDAGGRALRHRAPDTMAFPHSEPGSLAGRPTRAAAPARIDAGSYSRSRLSRRCDACSHARSDGHTRCPAHGDRVSCDLVESAPGITLGRERRRPPDVRLSG